MNDMKTLYNSIYIGCTIYKDSTLDTHGMEPPIV